MRDQIQAVVAASLLLCASLAVGQTQYTIVTAAGPGHTGYLGDQGPALRARIDPESVALDAFGNVYVADTDNNRVRKIAPDGTITTVAGNGNTGYSGDGVLAIVTTVWQPFGVAVDTAGNLYIADTGNSRIRKVTTDGIIHTVAGSAMRGGAGDEGPATSAGLSGPEGVAVDVAGNLYIADTWDNRIRKVTTDGIIHAFAGNGDIGSTGDGGPAISAMLTPPYGLALDAAGNVYIADTANNRIRKVSLDGIITTVAGGGSFGYSGDGGPAVNAGLNQPYSVAVDSAGSLYIADTWNYVVRRVTPDGTIATIAGTGVEGYADDNGPATSAMLSFPIGIAVDAFGNVIFGDSGNNRVRALVPVSGSCTYSVNQTTVPVPVAGASVPVMVDTAPSCAWIVSGLPGWIASRTYGTGPGTVTLFVDANGPAARQATISIAGQPVLVEQQGMCIYALDPTVEAFPAAGGTGSVNIIAGQGCLWSALGTMDWATFTGTATGAGAGTVTYQVGVNAGAARSGILTVAGLPFTVQQVGATAAGLRFVPVSPCRVADTRWATGPFGGPTMAAAETRSFPIPQSACGIPGTAQAYSLNVTVVPQGPLYYLTLWPTGQSQAMVSTLNSFEGNVVANAAIVPAGTSGAVSVFVTNPADVILDIGGYFDSPANNPNSYSFYPATPCRAVDTRGSAGTFGGPAMWAGQSRDFPIPLSSCGIPPTARGYSLNTTVVPAQTLSYLTLWPTGQPRPMVSTLNSWTGDVVANGAIVPAGSNESVSVFVTNPTDVILDIDGYFGAAGGAGALNFYPVSPCRVADTRNPAGPFGGPEMAAGTTRSFSIPLSGCFVPASAAAYSVNITVVPDGPLPYLTVWPAGSTQPLVSTLNSFEGTVVANAAIVAAGSNSQISVYVTNRTHVILDVSGYFAP